MSVSVGVGVHARWLSFGWPSCSCSLSCRPGIRFSSGIKTLSRPRAREGGDRICLPRRYLHESLPSRDRLRKESHSHGTARRDICGGYSGRVLACHRTLRVRSPQRRSRRLLTVVHAHTSTSRSWSRYRSSCVSWWPNAAPTPHRVFSLLLSLTGEEGQQLGQQLLSESSPSPCRQEEPVSTGDRESSSREYLLILNGLSWQWPSDLSTISSVEPRQTASNVRTARADLPIPSCHKPTGVDPSRGAQHSPTTTHPRWLRGHSPRRAASCLRTGSSSAAAP